MIALDAEIGDYAEVVSGAAFKSAQFTDDDVAPNFYPG